MTTDDEPRSVSGELGCTVAIATDYAETPKGPCRGPHLTTMNPDIAPRATVAWYDETSPDAPERHIRLKIEGTGSPSVQLLLCEGSGRALRDLLIKFFDQSPPLEVWRQRN